MSLSTATREVITTRGPNRGVKRYHQWSGSQPAPYLPPRLILLTLPWSSMLHEACTTQTPPPRRRTWQLSCTNTSCKDDIVLNRWERLLRATEWPMTTVTVTHIKWNDRNENKSIYTTLSPTQTTQVATKRNEILPLHQEVVNRLEAHFTRPLCPCRSPFHTGEPNS
jgi:hypothetical protein